MDTASTLFDAIKDKEAFEQTVAAAIHHSLSALGDDIYKLEWANMALKAEASAAKAA